MFAIYWNSSLDYFILIFDSHEVPSSKSEYSRNREIHLPSRAIGLQEKDSTAHKPKSRDKQQEESKGSAKKQQQWTKLQSLMDPMRISFTMLLSTIMETDLVMLDAILFFKISLLETLRDMEQKRRENYKAATYLLSSLLLQQ